MRIQHGRGFRAYGGRRVVIAVIALLSKPAMRKPFKRPDGIYWRPKAPGKQAGSWWCDIPSFATRTKAKEYLKYPTQKPLALLERIIKAGSDASRWRGIVFDLFCGCATTLVAADRLQHSLRKTALGSRPYHCAEQGRNRSPRKSATAM